MTIHRSPRSLRRLSDSRIADMVRHYVQLMGRDQLPGDFGLTMLHKASRIDAEIRRAIEGNEKTPARKENATGAHAGGEPAAPDTSPSGRKGKSRGQE